MKDEGQQRLKRHTPIWEKIIGGLGMLFLAGVLIFLVYEALQPNTPPSISVTTQRIVPVTNGYLVEIEAHNSGGETGTGVEIEGTLTPSDDPQGEAVESSTLTFDYVPAESTRSGGLFFRANPADYLLEVHAKSYAKP